MRRRAPERRLNPARMVSTASRPEPSRCTHVTRETPRMTTPDLRRAKSTRPLNAPAVSRTVWAVQMVPKPGFPYVRRHMVVPSGVARRMHLLEQARGTMTCANPARAVDDSLTPWSVSATLLPAAWREFLLGQETVRNYEGKVGL